MTENPPIALCSLPTSYQTYGMAECVITWQAGGFWIPVLLQAVQEQRFYSIPVRGVKEKASLTANSHQSSQQIPLWTCTLYFPPEVWSISCDKQPSAFPRQCVALVLSLSLNWMIPCVAGFRKKCKAHAADQWLAGDRGHQVDHYTGAGQWLVASPGVEQAAQAAGGREAKLHVRIRGALRSKSWKKTLYPWSWQFAPHCVNTAAPFPGVTQPNHNNPITVFFPSPTYPWASAVRSWLPCFQGHRITLALINTTFLQTGPFWACSDAETQRCLHL